MRVGNAALTGEYRDYPVKRGVPYSPARTNRLKSVLAQALSAHQGADTRRPYQRISRHEPRLSSGSDESPT